MIADIEFEITGFIRENERFRHGSTPMASKPDKDQKKRFIETARQIGADEDEKSFADKLRRIAKPASASPVRKPAKPK